MRQAALRWGLLLSGLLLLLAAAGYQSERYRDRVYRLRLENRALKARVRELEAELSRVENPRAVLRWSREKGFVPLAKGRWVR